MHRAPVEKICRTLENVGYARRKSGSYPAAATLITLAPVCIDVNLAAVAFRQKSRNVVVENEFSGSWFIPMTGYYSLSRDVVGFNDWRGSRFGDSFATDLKTAKYITPQQWKRFEVESAWPTTQPVRR